MRQLRKKASIRGFFRSHAEAWSPVRLRFLLQDWDDGYNVGGLFRVADACGAEEVILTGKTPTPESDPRVAVTSLGAHRRVAWRVIASYMEAVATMKADGWSPVAVEVADDAVRHDVFAYPEKTLLVLGTEGAGVFDKVLRECTAAVFIPMNGKGRSLNVHVAAAIVAFAARLSPTPELES
ncbi:MAG: tRNA methyltransferase [Armatimonadota bacterium]